MCGYGGFSGGHLFSLLLIILVVFGAIYFFKRNGNFCCRQTAANGADSALVKEIQSLRQEVESLKQHDRH